jgi:serine/threonine protein kinase
MSIPFRNIPYQNIQYLPKSSASPTNIYFAELNGEDVAIKAYVKPVDTQYTSSEFIRYMENIGGLDYEENIYREIVPTLAEYSPNMIEYINTHTLIWEEFIKFISTGSTTSYKEQSIITFSQLNALENIYDSYEDVEYDCEVIFVVTKRSKNITSLKKLLSMDIPKEEVIILLFQLMYNLTLFGTAGLIHNDLHSDNILVDVNDQPITLHYRCGSSTYEITTKYVLKFFDWDFSYINLLGENKKIDDPYWANLGILNSFDKKFDLFTLICYMTIICKNSKGSLGYCASILKSLIKDDTLLRNNGGYYDLSGFWMKGTAIEGYPCRAKIPIPDSVLDTPMTILNSDLFSHLKINNSSVTGTVYSIPNI